MKEIDPEIIDQYALKQLEHLKNIGELINPCHTDIEYCVKDSYTMGFLTAQYLLLKQYEEKKL